MSANMFFCKYVVSGNLELHSVAGKQKHLFFLLIFSKVCKLCSAAVLVLAVSASSVLVSLCQFTNVRHHIAPHSVPGFPLVMWLYENLHHLEQRLREQSVVSQISEHRMCCREGQL